MTPLAIRSSRRGATTEVFIDDDSNDVVITVINSYVAQVDGDYDKNDEELELDILDEAFVDVKDTTLSSDDFDYLDSYSDEDYVLITVANKEIKTIDLAETVEGKVTAYTEKKNVTVDGTKYEYSKNYTDAVKEDSNLSYDLNDAYNPGSGRQRLCDLHTDGTAVPTTMSTWLRLLLPAARSRPGGRMPSHRRPTRLLWLRQR